MIHYLTIGIADDDNYWKSTLYNFLRKNNTYDITFTSINGYDLVKQAIAHKPLLLIIDSHMPLLCGIEAAIVLKSKLPNTKIICLSMIYQPFIAEQLLKNGIEGYTTKDCDFKGLQKALVDVLSGIKYYENNNSTDEEFARIKEQVDGINSYNLSASQIETLQLLAKGFTNQQVCDKRGEDVRTVESRVKKIKSIFGAQNIQQLLYEVTSLGIIPPHHQKNCLAV